MKSILGKMFFLVAQTYVYRLLMRWVVPYARIPRKSRFPLNRWALITNAIIKDRNLNPYSYYCFCVSDKACLAHWLVRLVTKEPYQHTGIFFPGIHDTIEMRAVGFDTRTLYQLLSSIDNIAVVAFRFSGEDYLTIQDKILTMHTLKLPYDIEQDVNSKDSLYCSELVFRLFKESQKNMVPKTDFGRMFYSPGQVYMDGQVIIEHREGAFYEDGLHRP